MLRTGPVLYWCDDCKQRRRFTYDLQSARLLRAEEGEECETQKKPL